MAVTFILSIIFGKAEASYTLDIFAHNIAIKIHCDKNIILSHECLKAKQKLAQGAIFSALTLVS